jgi:hypothetical protein
MRSLLYSMLIILVLVSCKEQNQDERKDLREITFDFTPIRVKPPNRYKSVSIEKLRELMMKSDLSEEEKMVRIDRLNYMVLGQSRLQFLVDTADVYDIIWVAENEYVRLNKQLISHYLGTLTKSMNEQMQDVPFKRLENKFFDGPKTQLLKIKYALGYDSSHSFLTQYILTTQTETVGLMVSNSSGEDFEELVKKIKLK